MPPSPAEPAAAGARVLLDRRARPRGAQVGIIVLAALAAGAAAGWLAHAIDSDPQGGWGVPLAAGAAIAALVCWFAMLGAQVVVDAAGLVTYSLHGRPNLAFDLGDVAGMRPVASGLLRGIGLELEPTRTRFLHKAGISPERMRRWRAECGVDLVLEGFPPELVAELAQLRAQLRPFAAGAAPRPA